MSISFKSKANSRSRNESSSIKLDFGVY